MKKLILELKEQEKAIWFKRPDDVARMVGRNYNTGKEFSCWACCWGDIANLANAMYMVYDLAKKQLGDLETYKMMCSMNCESYSEGLESAGHMDDTVKLLNKSAVAFREVKDFNELCSLCRALQRYLVQLNIWVDMELPWADICELVHRIWHAEDRAIVK